MGAHTTSDDPTKYRVSAEVEVWKLRDPIERLKAYLAHEGMADAGVLRRRRRARPTSSPPQRARGLPDDARPEPPRRCSTTSTSRTHPRRSRRERAAATLAYQAQLRGERTDGSREASPSPRASTAACARPWRPTPRSSSWARTSASSAASSASPRACRRTSARTGSSTPRSPSPASSAPRSAWRCAATARSCEIQFDGFVYPAFDQIVSQVAKMRARSLGTVKLPDGHPHPRRRRHRRGRAPQRVQRGLLRPHRRPAGRRLLQPRGRLLDDPAGHRDRRPGDLLRAQAPLLGQGARSTSRAGARAACTRPHVVREGDRRDARRPTARWSRPACEAASRRRGGGQAASRSSTCARCRRSTVDTLAASVREDRPARRRARGARRSSAWVRRSRRRITERCFYAPRGAGAPGRRLQPALPAEQARGGVPPRPRPGPRRRRPLARLLRAGRRHMAMSKQFNLPDPGEGLTEAEIVTWKVKPSATPSRSTTSSSRSRRPSRWSSCPSRSPAPSPSCSSPRARPSTSARRSSRSTTGVGDGDAAGTGAGARPRAGAEDERDRGGQDRRRRPRRSHGRPRRLRRHGTTEAKRRPRKGTSRRRRRLRRRRPGGARRRVAPARRSRRHRLPTAGAAPSAASRRARPGGGRALAKPPVRKLAKDLGVDLADGRRRRATAASSPATTSRPARRGARRGARRRPTRRAGARRTAPGRAARPGERETRIPIKGVRKMTAQAMVGSAFTAPHVTEWITVDVTRTMELVERLQAATASSATSRSRPLLVRRQGAAARGRGATPASTRLGRGRAGDRRQALRQPRHRRGHPARADRAQHQGRRRDVAARSSPRPSAR